MGTARSHRRQTSSCSICGWTATLRWLEIAVDVAIVSGLVMLALLVYADWERLRR